jgi:hypothetical protein
VVTIVSGAGRESEVERLVNQQKVDVNSVDFQTGNSALHAAANLMLKGDDM